MKSKKGIEMSFNVIIVIVILVIVAIITIFIFRDLIFQQKGQIEDLIKKDYIKEEEKQEANSGIQIKLPSSYEVSFPVQNKEIFSPV